MPHYMFTLTRANGGFTDIEVNLLVIYFEKQYEQVLVTSELHKSGGIHLHGVCDDPVKEVTSLTKKLIRLYDRLNIPCVKNISIKIKKCTKLNGALAYCLKECSGSKGPLLCRGWDLKTLQRQALASLKQLSDRSLSDKYHFVNQRAANGLIIRYAKAAGLPIVNKASFIAVLCAMGKDQYQFSSVKMSHVYGEVMAELGDESVMRDHYEMLLSNIK